MVTESGRQGARYKLFIFSRRFLLFSFWFRLASFSVCLARIVCSLIHRVYMFEHGE